MADSYSTIRQSYIERGGEYSFIPSGVCRTIAHVNNIPTMQFFTGISRNTQSKCYHCPSVSGNSEIMHCGILYNMHYCKNV